MSDSPSFIRENWPLRSGMGSVTTHQRTGLHKAAGEIEALQKRCEELEARSDFLEWEMRRYLFDRDHARRAKVLDQYREMAGAAPWADLLAPRAVHDTFPKRQALSPNKDMDDE